MSDLTDAQLRYLLALVVVYERDGRATVRAVASVAGRALAPTHAGLDRLRRDGFAAYDGPGSLRPLVYRPEMLGNIPR